MAVADIRQVVSANAEYFSAEDLAEIERMLDGAAARETEQKRQKAGVNRELSEAHKEKGNAEYKSRNYLEAVEHYTHAISEDPFNEVLYSNRAAAYAMMKADDQGIEDCLAALNINPRYAKAHVRLGDFYAETDVEKAREHYTKARALEPNNASVDAKIKKLHSRAGKDASLAELLKSEEMQNLIKSKDFKDIFESFTQGDTDISKKLKDLDLK